jgi:signal transduction histidine kinase
MSAPRGRERDAAIGAVAAGVAHDVSNMLLVVLGSAEMLERRLGASAASMHELTEIRSAAQRASELVRQMLALGRRGEARPERLDLADVIARIERMLCILAGPDIDVQIARCPEVNPIVGDRARVEEIVVNLVTNARDAMDGAPGAILIQIDNVERAGAAHVLLGVKDSGVGMDEATKARIFEPFFTTKDRGDGSGLGLSVVAGLVEEIGGAIEVSSTPGGGTVFRVYFPAAADPNA